MSQCIVCRYWGALCCDLPLVLSASLQLSRCPSRPRPRHPPFHSPSLTTLGASNKQRSDFHVSLRPWGLEKSPYAPEIPSLCTAHRTRVVGLKEDLLSHTHTRTIWNQEKLCMQMPRAKEGGETPKLGAIVQSHLFRGTDTKGYEQLP